MMSLLGGRIATLLVVTLCLSLMTAGYALRPSFGLRESRVLRQASRLVPLRSTAEVATPEASTGEERVIVITPKAKNHLEFMKSKQASAVTLRMGVRAGGCSGMSYVMDFIKEEDVQPDDHVEMYDDIKCVVDPKSLLFLFGLQLDYSDELIGGGFKFTNPNAGTSCGCGKSFGI
jgi:iron-sulfur cluster assembly protein